MDNKKNRFFIYSTSASYEFLRESLQPYQQYGIKTELVTDKDVLGGCLNDPDYNVLAFFLPGTGTGQTYRKDLGAAGATVIKDYVKSGGCFIGICAGGYFSCEDIDYTDLSGINHQLTSDFGFFPAVAQGGLPFIQLPKTQETKGWEMAQVLDVTFNSLQGAYKAKSLYWGGAQLIPKTLKNDMRILATYDGLASSFEQPAIAMASIKYGEGRAVFSGPHPEISSSMLATSASAKMIDHDGGELRKLLAEELAIGEKGRKALFELMVREAFDSQNGIDFLQRAGLRPIPQHI